MLRMRAVVVACASGLLLVRPPVSAERASQQSQEMSSIEVHPQGISPEILKNFWQTTLADQEWRAHGPSGSWHEHRVAAHAARKAAWEAKHAKTHLEKAVSPHVATDLEKAVSHLELADTAVAFDGRGHARKEAATNSNTESPNVHGRHLSKDDFSRESMARELHRHGVEPMMTSQEIFAARTARLNAKPPPQHPIHGYREPKTWQEQSDELHRKKPEEPEALLVTYEHLGPKAVPGPYDEPETETLTLPRKRPSLLEVREAQAMLAKTQDPDPAPTAAVTPPAAHAGGGTKQPGEAGYDYPTAPDDATFKASFKTSLKTSGPAPEAPMMTHEEILKSTPKSWDALQTDFKTRFDVRENHWAKALKTAAGSSAGVEMKEHQQYEGFASKVLSLSAGQIPKFMETAKDTTQKNADANWAGYQYVDDLMKLANAQEAGYQLVGENHWKGFDDIRGQLQEGKMTPGQSTRMMFAFGGKIAFQSCSKELYDDSKAYVKDVFIPEIAKKMELYAGRHFTICIHSATNLNSNMVPDKYNSLEQQEKSTFKDKDGEVMEITKGIKQMLDERFETVQKLMQEYFTSEVKKDGIKTEEEDRATGEVKEVDKAITTPEVRIPPIDDSMRHFGDKNDALLPSGAVLVIAEDRLHRDNYRAPSSGDAPTDTELAEAAIRQAAAVASYDSTNCKVDSFNMIANVGKFSQMSAPIVEGAPFMSGLPEELRSMTTAETRTGRGSATEFETMITSHASDPELEQIEGVFAMARAETTRLEALKVGSAAAEGSATADVT